MLWLIFCALAEALYVISTGFMIAPHEPTKADSKTLDNNLAIRPGFQSIVNTDIKLMNVGLSHPQPTHYPAYKTAKMIDFGIAELTTKWPDKNSKHINGRSG